MFLARVVGEVVATVKHPHLAAQRLLLTRYPKCRLNVCSKRPFLCLRSMGLTQ